MPEIHQRNPIITSMMECVLKDKYIYCFNVSHSHLFMSMINQDGVEILRVLDFHEGVDRQYSKRGKHKDSNTSPLVPQVHIQQYFHLLQSITFHQIFHFLSIFQHLSIMETPCKSQSQHSPVNIPSSGGVPIISLQPAPIDNFASSETPLVSIVKRYNDMVQKHRTYFTFMNVDCSVIVRMDAAMDAIPRHRHAKGSAL